MNKRADMTPSLSGSAGSPEALGGKAPASALARVAGLRGARKFQDAMNLLLTLRGQWPDDADLIFEHAAAYQGLGHLAEAVVLYGHYLHLRPGDSTALFANAVCLAPEYPEHAGPWFLKAAQEDPLNFEAYLRALKCARALVRSGRVAPGASLGVLEDKLISVVCCSITPKKLETLQRNLGERLRNWEMIHIRDALSLAEGYSRGLRQSKGEFLVFCHDDIRVLDPDFSARLRHYLDRYDIIGVAGATQCSGPAALWSGPPSSHGWISYADGNGTHTVAISSARGPVIEGAQILDGVFIAGKRSIFEAVGWDATTFNGFHLYDIDFTLRAHKWGARIAICQDLMIEHASRGGFDSKWNEYAERFKRKFPTHCTSPHFDGPNAVEIEVASAEEASAVCAWMRAWLVEMNGMSDVAAHA